MIKICAGKAYTLSHFLKKDFSGAKDILYQLFNTKRPKNNLICHGGLVGPWAQLAARIGLIVLLQAISLLQKNEKKINLH